MARVKDIVMTGRLMSVDEMIAAGLLVDLVPEEDLTERAQQLAERLASNAPLTLWATKEALRRLRNSAIPASADEDLIVRCYMSADFREGVDSFLAKRQPIWTGQ
jgi:enoyl-CoA hydratase